MGEQAGRETVDTQIKIGNQATRQGDKWVTRLLDRQIDSRVQRERTDRRVLTQRTDRRVHRQRKDRPAGRQSDRRKCR